MHELETEIHVQIGVYRSKYGEFPSFLVVNPTFVTRLEKLIKDHTTAPKLKSLKYAGLEVYRSEDLKENEFKLG